MKRPFVTIILAGGKGTRMGSSDHHKVCFEVLGVPVIIRALETYNLCGAMLNIVVVGMMAESVMATVNQRFPGTVYAFQEKPLGTGNAARKGAEILERMRFEGDVLVVAGDKVIEPGVIRRMLATHERTRRGCDAGHRQAAAEFQHRHPAQVAAGQHRGHSRRSRAAALGRAGGDQRRPFSGEPSCRRSQVAGICCAALQ